MSTALLHHQRSHLIAAAAAILAITSIGVVLEVTRDDGPVANGNTSVTNPVPQFHLTGGTHDQWSGHHAGTTSGGQVQLAL